MVATGALFLLSSEGGFRGRLPPLPFLRLLLVFLLLLVLFLGLEVLLLLLSRPLGAAERLSVSSFLFIGPSREAIPSFRTPGEASNRPFSPIDDCCFGEVSLETLLK